MVEVGLEGAKYEVRSRIVARERAGIGLLFVKGVERWV